MGRAGHRGRPLENFTLWLRWHNNATSWFNSTEWLARSSARSISGLQSQGPSFRFARIVDTGRGSRPGKASWIGAATKTVLPDHLVHGRGFDARRSRALDLLPRGSARAGRDVDRRDEDFFRARKSIGTSPAPGTRTMQQPLRGGRP